MSEIESQIAVARDSLKVEFDGLEDKSRVRRSATLKGLYDQLKTLPAEQRAAFGAAINGLKHEVISWLSNTTSSVDSRPPIDISAPFDVNTKPDNRPELLSANLGSQHPLMREMTAMLDIFQRMGFSIADSKLIDDDYHMFGSLNFPEGHPARDDMDTFMLTDKGKDGKPLIAPAHTSIMQSRVLATNKVKLEEGESIAYVVPGRVFRNEDLDARHEHTFYQIEGIYVSENVTVGNLTATLKAFMQEYYQQELEIKTQPFYFPFTEPSFEFAQSCPFCQKKGCSVCSQTGWIELLGCGMIHPNVLKEQGIDPNKYTGFAWGLGFMRMVMIKYGIEDIRHLEAGKLDFLRQFA